MVAFGTRKIFKRKNFNKLLYYFNNYILKFIRFLFIYIYIILLTFLLFFDYFYIKFKVNLRTILIFLIPLSLVFFIVSEAFFLYKNYKPYEQNKIIKNDQKKLFILDELDYCLAFDANLQNNSEFLDLYKIQNISKSHICKKSRSNIVGSNSILNILSPKFKLNETDLFMKNFRKDNFKTYNNKENIFSYLREKKKFISLYGQFHPYCSIFKSYLSQCSYTFKGIYSNFDIIVSNFANQYKIFDKFNFIKFKKQFSNLQDNKFIIIFFNVTV